MQDFIMFISQHWFLSLLWLATLLLIVWNEFRIQAGGIPKLTPQEVVLQMNSYNALLLDFRDKTSFINGHILGAKHVQLDDFLAKDSKYKRLKNKRIIILIHHSDAEAIKIGQKLKTQGFEKINFLAKGMLSWKQMGMPIHNALQTSSLQTNQN